MGVQQVTGMRAKFQSWLSSKKGLTLTKYNKLAKEAKGLLYVEYQNASKVVEKKAA